ncbi:MAG: AmmeMemoRadiSam system protein B [Gammaproteobacteria bacterium]|nr:AmmeMemoRadiSam system protein B [Gammaproteobacteria bacterium]NNL06247.1 AmmeMemoRadiSam system protein B [Gammaproteobacteria bacterium]
MSRIRPAAVAGLFYPADASQLHRDIRSMLESVEVTEKAPKALIVPHAGYIFSGPIAASAFAQLKSNSARIKRVILLGPCHRVPLRGLATSSADFFETPLGRVKIDHEAINMIASLPQVREFDLTHEQEHSLEVQLPFLQEILPDFSLVPIVVGDTGAEEVSEVLENLWGGDETLIVISSDLSHYHDYNTARAMDSETCVAIEELNPAAIHYDQACGRNPVTGLLLAAKQHGLDVTTLDLRNSGDTSGDKSSVVGYGAWAFSQATSR